MRWTERQVAMLGEMGIRGWWPERSSPSVPLDVGPADAGAAGVHGLADRSDGGNRDEAGPASASAPRETAPPATARFDTVLPEKALPETRPLALRGLAGLADLGATTLRAAAADCTACPLCAGRTRSVFGGTDARADWLVVGEPPVEADDRAGEPFAGKPGQLLDNLLRAVGVVRNGELSVPSARACATVPVKCRPPGNRAPTAEEFATCEAYLVRQIELADAKIVLAMGRAAQLLLRTDEPLGRLRGRVHRYRGLPLIVTYAPAYLLRHPLDKARAWEDLCLAVATLGAAAATN